MSETIHFTDEVEWPLTEKGRKQLLARTNMHSPTVYDPEIHHIDPLSLTPALGDLQYTNTLDVLQRRVAIRAGGLPNHGAGIPCFGAGEIMQRWGVTTAEQVAESVRADDPALHLTRMRMWLYEQGYKLRPIFTDDPGQDFSRGPLPVAAAMDALPFHISPSAFAVKYYYGLARPQQIVERSLRGTIEAPHWFLDELNRMGVSLENFAGWFQYGFPPHPRFIAMHSAVARCALSAFVFFDLDDRGLDAVNVFERNVAHGRDNGGVHTFDDSSEGLKGGTAAVKAVLPGIVENLGGDAQMVRDLLELV